MHIYSTQNKTKRRVDQNGKGKRSMEGNVCRHRKDVYRSDPQGRICRFYNYIRRINLCTDSEFDYNSHNYGCRFKSKCSYYIVKGRLFQSASIPRTQVELLQPLFNGLAEGRNETVNVYTEKYYDEDFIIVTIDKAKYEINVTAENVRSIVQSVVNRVALKL